MKTKTQDQREQQLNAVLKNRKTVHRQLNYLTNRLWALKFKQHEAENELKTVEKKLAEIKSNAPPQNKKAKKKRC
jgi:hypothetical protein